ncbi:transcription factor GTE1 [Canna indica]|uniref:Transcription factor GTE1 n=1 Tax=Canna indica TaxID=4628 RepID=A0AAQ3K947_9LILI|nr:transcription factor GTE1 [Canna indica]
MVPMSEETSLNAYGNHVGTAPRPPTNPHGDIERFRHCVDEYISKADELEQRVNEAVEYYATKKQVNNPKGISRCKGKEKKKAGVANNCRINNNDNNLAGWNRKEALCTKRMQELMRQFGTIMKQITQLKGAEPFMNPVDVESLGLDDYYEVIDRPMDFSTIKKKMEAKDDSGYKNVREIYADVRLVFTNAMTYNDEGSHYHVMAKTLLEKFEHKWLQLLPKVVEEEKRQKEASQTLANMQIVQETAYVEMVEDTNIELDELILHLEELKELVVQKCRKMSSEEKRKLGADICSLPAEDIHKALVIIAESNYSSYKPQDEVEIHMDAQRESTLWKLKFFLKESLELQAKNSAGKVDDNLKKRKKDICFSGNCKKEK